MGRDAADVAHGAVLRATQHSRAQRVSGHPGGHPGPYTPAVTEPTSLTRPRRRCYSGLSSHRPAARWPQVSLARPPQRSSPRSGLVATKSPQPPGAPGPGRYSKRQLLGPGQRLREGRVAPAGATQPLNWWLRVENIRRQPRPSSAPSSRAPTSPPASSDGTLPLAARLQRRPIPAIRLNHSREAAPPDSLLGNGVQRHRPFRPIRPSLGGAVGCEVLAVLPAPGRTAASCGM